MSRVKEWAKTVSMDLSLGLRVKSCYSVFQVSLDRDAIFVSADVDEVLSREALLRLRWLFSPTMKLV